MLLGAAVCLVPDDYRQQSRLEPVPAAYSESVRSRRDVHVPIGKTDTNGIQPFRDTSFPVVDLLSAADETDDHGPLLMPVQVGDEKPRLRLLEVGNLLAPFHEVSGLSVVPGALRLVEDDDVIERRIRSSNALVAEVMDVLNERLDLLADGSFARAGAEPREFIAGQRLLQNADKGLLPDRKTARASPYSRRFVATLRPTRVLPAPGTPVTKTIAFARAVLEPSMISSTATDVTGRFVAPAS